MSIAYPPVIINEYLAEKVPLALPGKFYDTFRFFPTQPTDIGSIVDSFPESSNDVFAVYDRMFRLRRGPFPHIKNEQLLYYFYKVNSNPELLLEVTQIIQDLLDREDETAEELNEWVRNHPSYNGQTITFGTGSLARDFKPVVFHNVKIFQLEESKDLNDFRTARTFLGNKVIIDYKYHIPQDANNS